MENGTKEVALGTQAIREVGEQFQDITDRVISIKAEMNVPAVPIPTTSLTPAVLIPTISLTPAVLVL